jgi:uncharacterized protein GlcG (DUF336 family)
MDMHAGWLCCTDFNAVIRGQAAGDRENSTPHTGSRTANCTGRRGTCRKEGIQIGVSVVDRSGDPMVVLRDTLAPRISLEISRQKAFTAVNFNAATSTMTKRFTEPFSVGKVDGLVFSAGGVPIEAAGNIVGAVGVSGAATGEQDEACAQASIKAIAFELESAGL